MHFAFQITHKIYIITFFFQKTKAYRSTSYEYSFLRLVLANGGITVDFECGGEAIPRVIFSMCSGTRVGGMSETLFKNVLQDSTIL